MKAILIDDEFNSRSLLQSLLNELCPEITKISEASNLIDGVKIIKEQQPDIVFLDIEMPEYSGLEIGRFFNSENLPFQLIYITAYNQYAIQALKISAIDYLLKPISDEELLNAVNKAKNNIEKNDIGVRLSKIENAFKQLEKKKIALEIPQGMIFVEPNDIILFEADGAYTKVYLKTGEIELICKTLKYFSEQLSDSIIFYKPHRSYLINLNSIIKFEKKDNYTIILSNKKRIPVARDKKVEFVELLKSNF